MASDEEELAMRSMNIDEASEKLGDLVDAVERGEPVLLTRGDKAVARLEPLGPRPAGPLPDLRAFRASIQAASAVEAESLSTTVSEARRRARY